MKARSKSLWCARTDNTIWFARTQAELDSPHIHVVGDDFADPLERDPLWTFLSRVMPVDSEAHVDVAVMEQGTLRKVKALVATIRRGIDNTDDARVAAKMASKAQVLVEELEGLL